MIRLVEHGIDIEPAFSAALAAIVIEWGRVEIGLLHDLERMRTVRHIKALEPRMPNGFNARTKLWRRSQKKLYGTIPSYEKFADHIQDRALELAPKRNLLVHGLWDATGPSASGVWKVCSFRRVHDRLDVIRADVDIFNLESTVAAIRSLSGDLAGFIVSKLLHRHAGVVTTVPDMSSSRDND